MSKFFEPIVGEDFNWEGGTYRAVETHKICEGCAFDKQPLSACAKLICHAGGRADGINIIIKEIAPPPAAEDGGK